MKLMESCRLDDSRIEGNWLRPFDFELSMYRNQCRVRHGDPGIIDQRSLPELAKTELAKLGVV